ncbi:MAG: hypothetical protein WC089_02215 [Candidatus Paceibacterota bacterium]
MNWKNNYSYEEYKLSALCEKQALSLINKWKDFFSKEETWVQHNFGVPSLFIRLDCVLREDSEIHIYEVEERPSGMGIANETNPRFRETLKEINPYWPEFKTVLSERRDGRYDCWTPMISMEDALNSQDLLLIKAEPNEEEFHKFENRSVSSLKQKGNKSYGLEMGLWKEVTVDDFNDFEWDLGFCLKAKQCSKARGVEIWYPHKKILEDSGISGISTKTRIKRVLEENNSMYYQSFIAPMLRNGDPMIFRLFFVYSPQIKDYVYAGGLWNSRKNYKIHGATDTTFGLVL